MASNKEIVALTDFEHVLERPTMYIGSVEKSEERLVLVRENKVVQDIKEISVGFYKLMIEVLDNAFDEAKRMKGEMKRIEIHFNTKDNSVEVVDTGGGFINASTINSKTGITNVASAMSMLRAGSNFKNSATQENLIGTNGVGASIVNMLSDKFSIKTINSTESYTQNWEKFISNKPLVTSPENQETGTRVYFAPRKDVFAGCTWDREYVHSMMIFRQFLMKTDPAISNLDFICTFDGEKLDLEVNFLPENYFKVDSKAGSIYVWESFPKSCSTSFVNGAICGGIHQRIIGEWIDDTFGTATAGKFYETFIVLNLPPNLVRFGDQNKTRFVTSRGQVSPTLEKNFQANIKKHLKNNPIYSAILKKVEESEREGNIRNLKNAKRTQKHKISDKYFPPSIKTKNLFIVEGGCIDENEIVNVYRNHEPISIKMNEIEIDDEILTHNNRYRKILSFQRKLKEVISINTSTGIIKVSKKHPMYVFDTLDKSFKFVKAEDLDITIHKLVKNRLANFTGNAEILSISITSDNKYPIEFILDNGIVMKNSETHKYCVYNIEKDSFSMKMTKDLVKGDLISLFE